MPTNRGITPTRFPEQKELRERFIQAARNIMGLDNSSEPVTEKQQVSVDLNESESDGDKNQNTRPISRTTNQYNNDLKEGRPKMFIPHISIMHIKNGRKIK